MSTKVNYRGNEMSVWLDQEYTITRVQDSIGDWEYRAGPLTVRFSPVPWIRRPSNTRALPARKK